MWQNSVYVLMWQTCICQFAALRVNTVYGNIAYVNAVYANACEAHRRVNTVTRRLMPVYVRVKP
jgi:hypothetical protein